MTPTKNSAVVAPPGEWVRHISQPCTCLSPLCGWTPCDINV